MRQLCLLAAFRPKVRSYAASTLNPRYAVSPPGWRETERSCRTRTRLLSAPRRPATSACWRGCARSRRSPSRTASNGATVPRRSTSASRTCSSPRALSRSSTRTSDPTPTTPPPTPRTWRGSRTGPSSAPSRRRTPARPTTGRPPPRCGRSSRASRACSAAP